ncbi:Transcription initiation factor IIA gamma subunit [Spraguea lophii 42_110]|uniref:Transcription initiation factor IIA subunit 2 n=1 Tax=Spraguea lophii (strain 42_110) TaxID=1358809 RepID=S7XLC7_SPRLO|nr:Transcription initiation factor IIA gamma subunit [Spraguea lophii 42_110]
MYEFYRETIIGKALQDAIEEKINNNQITTSQAEGIIKSYDDVVPMVFGRSVQSSINFRGSVNSYNHVDGVWKFSTKNFIMTVNNELVRSDFVKIVACDSDVTSGNTRKRKNKGQSG